MPVRFGRIPDQTFAGHPVLEQPYLSLVPPPEGLPPVVDRRAEVPFIFDQANEDCTANAACLAVAIDRRRQGLPPWTPSRRFNYRYSRARFGGQNQDAGSTISFAVASLVIEGICSEDAPASPGRWLYAEPVDQAPDEPAIYAAAHHRANWWWQVQPTMEAIRTALARGYFPIVGIDVWQSFIDAPNGDAPLPDTSQQPAGGHAVLAVGYDDTMQRLRFANSWGAWGAAGFGSIPYEYPTLADVWVVAREAAGTATAIAVNRAA